jgi:lipid II:glycine glycyltransferase (peptidoglycan interpeptide bridge formation enzyme)
MTILGFKYKVIWFSDILFDVKGRDCLIFRQCKMKTDAPGFLQSDLTTLITDTTRDLRVIWKKMSESNCRKPINRALKSGVTVKINQHYEDFNRINKDFRKKKGLSQWDLSIDFMKRYGTLFVTEYKGEILGGLFCLSDDDTMVQYITCSRRLEARAEDRKFIANANKLMIWESIMYAKEHGIGEYDWGGYYTGSTPDVQMSKINVYKKRFGGDRAIRFVYRKNYSVPIKIIKGVGAIVELRSGSV